MIVKKNPFTAAESVVDIVTWKQLYCMSQGHRDRAVKQPLSQDRGHCKKIMYDALKEIFLSCLALLQGNSYLYVLKPANKTPFDSTLSTANSPVQNLWQENCQSVFQMRAGCGRRFVQMLPSVQRWEMFHITGVRLFPMFLTTPCSRASETQPSLPSPSLHVHLETF